MSEKNIKGLSVHPYYLMFADELDQQVGQNGPHWAMIVRPVSESDNIKPGFKLACLGNGKWFNPVSRQFVNVEADTWVQRFHKDAVQFDMSATDAAIAAQMSI